LHAPSDRGFKKLALLDAWWKFITFGRIFGNSLPLVEILAFWWIFSLKPETSQDAVALEKKIEYVWKWCS
jgi:hypothetical protein